MTVDDSTIDIFTLPNLLGENVQRELIQRIEYLPNICTKLASGQENSILSLKSALDFYTEFMKHFHLSSKSDNEEFLPMIKYLIKHGNTTVYQWRTGGHVPVSVERPSLNYKFAETAEVYEEEANIILGLDDDLTTTSTEGIDVKQTANQSDTINFDTEAEIDWSAINTIPELLDSALTSNGTHPNSIPDALREAVLNESTHPIDDGIARGNDAFTLLENRSTYIFFIHELYRVSSTVFQITKINFFHFFKALIISQTTS
ncbi:unnamed protein product [Rotaria sp. Silwood1]|nr:unnamed protein product [Rotaria sp. Silwood1]